MSAAAARRPAVLLLSSLTPATGNAVTCGRLAASLAQLGYEPRLLDANNATADDVARVIHDTGAVLVVAMHAYRSGRHLLRCPVPYVVVLSGTDVNEHLRAAGVSSAAGRAGSGGAADVRPQQSGDPRDALMTGDKAAVIQRVVSRAAAVVTFSEVMRDGFTAAVRGRTAAGASGDAPRLATLRVIPQAVDVAPCAAAPYSSCAPASALAAAPSLHAHLGLPSATPVLLLPCGLRRVKAPTYMCRAFSEWRHRLWQRGATLPVLLIVGPPLEADTAAAVAAATGCDPSTVRVHRESSASEPAAPLAPCTDARCTSGRCGGRDGVYYHAAVPREVLLSWMAQAAAVLNTSDSEGMPNAVMEAMAVGTPVVVRANAGNLSVVTDGETGLVFSSPDAAVQACARLLPPEYSVAGAASAASETADAAAASAEPGEATELRDRLVAKARAFVAAQFSVAAEQQAWADLLRAIPGPAAPPAS